MMFLIRGIHFDNVIYHISLGQYTVRKSIYNIFPAIAHVTYQVPVKLNKANPKIFKSDLNVKTELTLP